MNADWQIAAVADWQADAVLFFAFENSAQLAPAIERWSTAGHGWLRDLLTLADFQGKLQQTAVYYGPPGQRIPRVICTGLGTVDGFTTDQLRTAAASALRKCRELHLDRVALPLSNLEHLPVEVGAALKEALIGAWTGLYAFAKLKSEAPEATESFPRNLLLLTDTTPTEPLQMAVRSARATASAICLARDLVMAPANRVTPTFLVETAQELADNYNLRLEVIDQEQAREMGMGAFSAVAQGSQEPASIIILEHAPAGTEQHQPIVLIGKGITFDTGGISIKSGHKMAFMKHDMAGAATVLATFKILGEMNIPKRVMAILPCTENMPDGKAYKPGDVIRSLSGLTIEVISTDAEGRMVLCDALTHAQRFNPAVIVDIATLTGSCIIALGDQVGAVMGNRQKLVQELQEIGSRVGDKLWPLPLWDFYFDDLESDVADFKNVGERKAGTIIGGIFLKQFVPDRIPWVHLDIAGPAWTDKDLPTAAKGATGFGVRILAELVEHWNPDAARDRK